MSQMGMTPHWREIDIPPEYRDHELPLEEQVEWAYDRGVVVNHYVEKVCGQGRYTVRFLTEFGALRYCATNLWTLPD